MTEPPSSPPGPAHGLMRRQEPGAHLVLVRRQKLTELHLTVLPLAGESVSGMLQRLHAVLREHQASVVRLHVFGSTRVHDLAMAEMRKLFGGPAGPVLWSDGADCAGGPIAGFYARAVSGVEVVPLRLNEQVVGCLYTDETARHCFIGGVGPKHGHAPRPAQVEQAYARLEGVLDQAGMDLTHVIRTWFYLDRILEWYDDFNCVRTTVFQRHGVFDKLVPASTGIGAANPAGTAVTLGARAMKPLTPAMQALALPSPLQCPAPIYGSSFSRAVELDLSTHRHVLVSGTASIEPGGRTVHAGDFPAQVRLTMEVVAAILTSRGMNYSDVTRATAYLRRAEDLPRFRAWAATAGLTELPVICARADICRNNLLFELELDALAETPAPELPNPTGG